MENTAHKSDHLRVLDDARVASAEVALKLLGAHSHASIRGQHDRRDPRREREERVLHTTSDHSSHSHNSANMVSIQGEIK